MTLWYKGKQKEVSFQKLKITMQPVNEHPGFFFFNPSGSAGMVDSSTSLTGYSAFDSGSQPVVNSNPPSRTPSFQSNTSYSNVKQNVRPQPRDGMILVTSAPDLNFAGKPHHPARDGKFVGSNISLARTPSFTVQINGKPMQGGKAPTTQRNSTGSSINVNVNRNSSLLRPSEVKYNSRVTPQRHQQQPPPHHHSYDVELRRNNKYQQQQQQRSGRPVSYMDRKDVAIPHVPVHIVPKTIEDKVCTFG